MATLAGHPPPPPVRAAEQSVLPLSKQSPLVIAELKPHICSRIKRCPSPRRGRTPKGVQGGVHFAWLHAPRRR